MYRLYNRQCRLCPVNLLIRLRQSSKDLFLSACVQINVKEWTGCSSLPYLTAETLVLRTAHRISFGNKNTGGHSHRQTWFCGISRRWELRSSGPEPASSPPPSSWLGPCKTQTAGAISCRQTEGQRVRDLDWYSRAKKRFGMLERCLWIFI